MAKFSTSGWTDDEILDHAYNNPNKVLKVWRTNNPGALNNKRWQERLPGWLGVTKDDGSGNVTSVWRTPEDGVAAFVHLLTSRYSLGDKTTLSEIAMRYSGLTWSPDREYSKKLYSNYMRAWLSYIDFGWHEVFSSSDPDNIAKVAYGIFRHESGKAMHVDRKVILRAAQRELGFRVATNPIVGTSKSMTGATASAGGGAIVLADAVPAVIEAVKSQEVNLASGEWVKIVVAVVILGGALLAIYSRWDDAGKPSLWGSKGE